jgi:para-aminobenzoate synthetase component 1
MKTFFAHFPATSERPFHILAKGVKDAFVVQENATEKDWEDLQHWINQNKGNWIFSLSSFESSFAFLKISSIKHDVLDCPSLIWVVPEEITIDKEFSSNFANNHHWTFKETITKSDYLDHLYQIHHHLKRGNFYETNYCMQIAANGHEENPYHIWQHLFQKNPAPHAVYWQWQEHHLLCLSPERFIQKKDNILISQPIKGTIAKLDNQIDDLENQAKLKNSKKERSENTMIVDLVRNDMSKIAQKGSVQVKALCDISSFHTLHHMVSTIECLLPQSMEITDIFRALFPMGSMTGVPKKIAVTTMNELEKNERGWYSGTCGYIEPSGNFDFNVIIRSMIYDNQKKISKIGIGSAITLQSNFESEWDECWLKSKSLLNLASNVTHR